MTRNGNALIRPIVLAVITCFQALFSAAQTLPAQTPSASKVVLRLRATLPGHTKNIDRIAFRPDGRLIGTSSEDQTVRIWDAYTGQLKEILSGEDKAKWELERWYVNTHYVKTRDFPDVYGGQLKETLERGAYKRAVSPDRRMLITVRRTDTAKQFRRSEVLELWDLATGRLKLTFEELPYGITRIYWSPNGKSIIVEGSARTRARLIDVSTGRVKAKLPYEACSLDSWFGSDDCGTFTFSADGKVFLKEQGSPELWSTDSGQLLIKLKSARAPATFSPTDRELLVTSSQDKRAALVWEIISR